MSKSSEAKAKQSLDGLGGTLRLLRRRTGLTLRELAEKVGCSESMLSKIERGHVNPTLKMMHQLARELKIKVAALLTENTDSPVYIRTPAARLKMKLAGSGRGDTPIILERATPYAEGAVLDANLHVIQPGMGSQGSYRHDASTVGYMVSGAIQLEIDGVVHSVAEGDTFFFDSRLPYGYHNAGTCEARIFWVNGFQPDTSAPVQGAGDSS